jgi:hypothetical protein
MTDVTKSRDEDGARKGEEADEWFQLCKGRR